MRHVTTLSTPLCGCARGGGERRLSWAYFVLFTPQSKAGGVSTSARQTKRGSARQKWIGRNVCKGGVGFFLFTVSPSVLRFPNVCSFWANGWVGVVRLSRLVHVPLNFFSCMPAASLIPARSCIPRTNSHPTRPEFPARGTQGRLSPRFLFQKSLVKRLDGAFQWKWEKTVHYDGRIFALTIISPHLCPRYLKPLQKSSK